MSTQGSNRIRQIRLAMPRFGLIIFAIVGLVFASSLGLLLALKRAQVAGLGGDSGTSSRRSSDPLVPDEGVKGLSIPPFSLLDQDGKTIDNSIFTNKVTIVDLFFTHCKLICPVLTQHLADQARALKKTNVRILSISVDPEHDTPEVIKAYGIDHGADPSKWTFATGDRQTIGRIVEQGLHFAVGDDPSPDRAIDLGGGKKMNNIVHPSWFALVGPHGEVLGVYLAEMEEDMVQLTERAKAASAKLKP
jgi:cytochrome oxidase Cu insertion factor (SCO1/SenC/PrrC family)